MVVEIVRTLESEGQYPQADYAFDQGVLTRPVTALIEAKGKYWGSEIERTRLIMWDHTWHQVQYVSQQLKETHPESFRYKKVRCRNGEYREIWAFTKVVRLKRYGRKRLVFRPLNCQTQVLTLKSLHNSTFKPWSSFEPLKVNSQ